MSMDLQNLNTELFIGRLISFAKRCMSAEYVAPWIDDKMVPHFNELCKERDYIQELKQGKTLFMHFSTSCGYGACNCADGLEHENLLGLAKNGEDTLLSATFVGFLLKYTKDRLEVQVATKRYNGEEYSINIVEKHAQNSKPIERFISQCSHGGEQRVLNVILEEGGKAYSDFGLLDRAYEIVQRYREGEISSINVSTGNIIEALRVLVSRGELNHSEIVINFGGEEITLDKLVNYSSYPKGFMDWEKGFLREIIEKRIGRKIGGK